MPWFNPSQEEATEQYTNNKNKYNSAVNSYNASVNQENNLISQKSAAESQLNQCRTDKMNFEQRLEGIVKIIKMLEGSGGWFSTDVPGSITKAEKAVQKADNSYRKSIKLTEGGSTANLADAFHTKSVAEESHSSAALSAYKSEKTKLETDIQNLKTQISNLSGQISSLSSQIRACNSAQSSLKKTMNSCAYNMNHYHKYMY
ncbi:MAG: hypothetical protein U0L49_01635 [Eubacterium sp.]|nr:hypothetical protein [Eubacterium sp.]